MQVPPRFACYTTNQRRLSLFKLEAEAATPPIISNITQSPEEVTSDDAVSVSADVAEGDAPIEKVELHWNTTNDFAAFTTITMTLDEGSTYATDADIPVQTDGTTVYYRVYAEDTDEESSTSAVQSYTVTDPATATVPFSEDFENDLGDFYTYSVSGDTKFWIHNSGNETAQMNGHDSGDIEEDWLIFPGFDLADLDDAILTFHTWRRYGSDDEDNYLKLKYSTDYAGIGNPELATWNEITFSQATTEQLWTDSGIINLSEEIVTKEETIVWLAFKYLYEPGNYVWWQIDNIEIFDASDPSLTAVPESLSGFSYIEGDGPSEIQSFTVSGENLTANVTIAPPADYEISEDENFSAKDGNIVLSPDVEGELAETTIYVRLKAGLDIDEYEGDITVTSDGASAQTVSLSGEVTPPPPGLPYTEDFADFVSLATLPNGWEVSNTTYIGDWGAGTAAGLRGNANVLGFQHTASTGIFTASLSLVNNTGGVIDELFVSYTGKVERNDQNRYPEWTVTINDEEVTGLFYSTLDAIDKHTGALITDLNIGIDEVFTLSWSSTRGDLVPGEISGASRQIGISNVSVKAAESFVLYAAADDASNYGGTWGDGSNEGYGFEEWDFNQDGNAGFFIGDPDAAGISGMSSESFGLFANPAGGNFADANRAFENPLPIGSTFSVDWGVNWTGGPDGNKGINIYSGGISGMQIININLGEDSDVINIEGSPMFSNYGTQVMTLNFEYLGNGDLRVYGTGRDGIETYDQTFTDVGAPDAVRFYASNLSVGDNHQPYFDNLKISTDPSGLPPDATVIVKGINVIDTEVIVENIIVEDGSSLLIAPTGKLTVNGTIDNQNNGSKSANGLLIQSDATGTGSLIHNTPGVLATAERYIAAVDDWGTETAVDWHMISSPVANQSITGGWIADGVAANYDFFAWGEATGEWLNQKIPGNNIDDFIPGQGYLVAYRQTVTNTFTGELNAGEITIALSNSTPGEKDDWLGWNLLGNPFPSAIDWGQVDRNTYFEDDFAYVWNREKTGGPGYEQIDGDGEGDAFIPANQGFFVLVKDGQNDAEFTFNNNIRVHGPEFMKNNDTNPERLIVRLAGETYFDQSTIRIKAGTDFERDRRDALKLFSFAPYVPQIFSLTSDNIMVAVNSIPKLDAEREITLGTRIPEDGEYTLSVQEMGSIFQAESLLLIDSHEGIVHDLKKNPTYEFIAEAGDEQGRFRLRFSPLDDDDPVNVPETDPQDALKLWFHNNTLFVDNASGDTELRLYNSAGRFLQSFRAGMGQQSFELQLSAGVYVVHSTGRTYGEPLKIVIY